MATVKGIWKFNDTLNIETGIFYNGFKFASHGQYFYGISTYYSSSYFVLVYSQTATASAGQGTWVYDESGDTKWTFANTNYQTINFGSAAQDVSDEFYAWLIANATPETASGVTIKYKDTTIPVEAGQTVTLHTTDKKFTEDLEIITSESAVEDWDGTIIVEGGTISFTIDSVSYEAEDGMTWTEWVESGYNPDYDYAPNFKKFYITGDTVYQNETGSGTPIDNAKPDSEIIEGYDYTLKESPTSGGGSN